MSPEEFQSGMSQAQSSMAGQKDYMLRGAKTLKTDGNAHVAKGEYKEALPIYERALENLKPHSGSDVVEVRLSLMLNAALCHLKLKEWGKAVNVCEDALTLDPRSVKATFRKGQARFELGHVAEAVAYVRRAAELSPKDEAIAAELKRIEAQCQSKGISEDDIKAEEKKLKDSSSSTPATSSSSKASPASAVGGQDMSEAVDKLSKNPEMLQQATDMMSKMDPETLSKLMSSQGMPAGMTPEMMKSQMEALSKNPDMVKSAVENLQGMPEEDRKRMLSQRMQGGAAGGVPAPKDMESMSKVFENPDMMKQMAQAAKASGVQGEEAEMMQKAAEEIASNPELGKQMSDMLKNMPPEQLEKMMQMSSQMRSRQAGGSGGGAAGSSDGLAGSGGAPPMDQAEAMDAMMNDPEMMKAASEMMKNITPETLASMARAQGIELDESKAKLISKLVPFIPALMKGWRWFSKGKKMAGNMVGGGRNLMIIILVVVGAALYQYFARPTLESAPAPGPPPPINYYQRPR
eukprot:gnl/TRDRNA2_/TRDRNA2_164357_c0_seq9.p1 gnl/TRDRNA2_/TRDRNA2_164357_c0~~gnl/TRDRNA2_/TRDRNA2_164357_c0_seq9.p1  ORF type:complete len:609 (+),score=156.95 gnl/TRDRNA2_/TRDRNA2_164357_c0_seq9:273-1829(+)